MAEAPIRYLHGVTPVRVLAADYLVLLVERVDGKALDHYGLRKRDWIAKGAIYSSPTTEGVKS